MAGFFIFDLLVVCKGNDDRVVVDFTTLLKKYLDLVGIKIVEAPE